MYVLPTLIRERPCLIFHEPLVQYCLYFNVMYRDLAAAYHGDALSHTLAVARNTRIDTATYDIRLRNTVYTNIY